MGDELLYKVEVIIAKKRGFKNAKMYKIFQQNIELWFSATSLRESINKHIHK